MDDGSINEMKRRQFLGTAMKAGTGLMLAGSVPWQALGEANGFTESSDYNVIRYGAVGDAKTLNTSAIQKAIDHCAKNGGGRVVIPAGTFLSGSIRLKSNVELHLERGAVLLGSPYMKDYEMRFPLKDVRYGKYLRYALVFAQEAEYVTVSGAGTLNGNAQLGAELGELVNAGKKHKPESERPCLLWFDECKHILMKEVTFVNSAMWTEVYSCCSHVRVDGITVKENYFFNADGCDIVDCDNFIVENCDINAHDDGICLKGYTSSGCSNGIIRNNKVRSICNGIKMGTDSSGGFRNILIENNEVWQTGISGLALEITDGGIMEDIVVRDIKMDVVSTPVFMMIGTRNREIRGGLTVPVSRLRNVRISGVDAVVDKYETYHELERKHFDFIPYASSITGAPGHYIEDVTLENIRINVRGGFPEERTAEDALREIPEAGDAYPENRMFGVLPACGFFIRHARNIQMKAVEVSIRMPDGRPAFFLDDVHEAGFEDIKVDRSGRAPAFAVLPNCSSTSI